MSSPAALKDLRRKHRYRFPRQEEVADVLPPPGTPIAALKAQILPEAAKTPLRGRADMADHLRRLERTFAGKSALLAWHGLAISYLRRDTPLTARARDLFEEIWAEEGAYLARSLPSRWLISALQTFFDHGTRPGDREAGGMGFVYGNLIKVYEAERAATAPHGPADPDRFAPERFRGMFGFVPGNDILLNINRGMFEAASRAETAGPALFELLARARRSETAFSRIDRIAQEMPDAERRKLKFAFGAPLDPD